MSRPPYPAIEDVEPGGADRTAGSPDPVARPDAPAVRVLRQPDHVRWSTFVDRHPEASIFHTPEMHRVFTETGGHRPHVWAAADGDGEIRALLTVVSIATVGGPARVLTSRNVAFAGPLVDGDPGALAALLAASRRTGPAGLFTEIRHVADPASSAATLAAAGFRHEPHLNYLIDLTGGEGDLWRGVAASARRNVAKARRVGVTIEEREGPGAVDEAYPILADVYRRIRVPLPDRSLFDAAARILGPLGRFKVLLARHDGRAVGALTLLIHSETITYWYTGTLRDAWTFRPGDLLVARALETGRALGCRTFDFGGAGRPDEPYGVRDFKSKYGGRLVDFGRDVLVPSPVRLRLATAGYQLVRRFL